MNYAYYDKTIEKATSICKEAILQYYRKAEMSARQPASGSEG